MLVAVLLCLTACVAGEEFYAGVLKSPKAMLKLYNDFKTQEHQAFPSASENRFRFRVFRKTVEFIAQENAIDNGYESGLNFFADLTDQERQQYLGVNMSLFMPAPQDKPRTSKVVDAPMFPSSKSWVEEGAVTRVKNQGSCGSCWTFGAASSMETFYKAKSGVLRAFSEQELLDCTYDSNPNKDGCNGGWPSDCFTYAKAGHLASEKDYGYRAKDNKCRASSYENALIGAKVTGFETVSKGDFMTALSHGSLAVAFEVTNKFSMYKGGIFKDSECHGRINHAVTAVAYTPAYILVKNSWGGSWGDRGFVKFIRNYDNCGLLNYASHPTMVATSTKDTNAADIATNYDPDDQNTPTDAPDPNRFSGWTQIAGGLTRVSTGAFGVWGVNKDDAIYYRNEQNVWKRYGGALVDISVGRNEVWGVNSGQNIYQKVGAGGWVHIGGKLVQVSVSQNDRVWGVNAATQIYRRTGSTWVKIEGGLNCVSVGPSGVWGVNVNGLIFYREGTYGDLDTSGTRWTQIDGKLKWISSGNNLVVGTNSAGNIFYRAGITAENPKGTGWKQVAGGLVQIDVYNTDIWGVTGADNIYQTAAVTEAANCYDKASDCTTAYCQWESFSKKNCAKTCGHCHNDEDPTNSGDCPSGTTRCPDGTCKHVHMC